MFNYLYKKLIRVLAFCDLKGRKIINAIYRFCLPFIFWVKFLLHSYDHRQFNPSIIKKNLLNISTLHFNEWLDASAKGELRKLRKEEQSLWLLKNFFLFGALRSRLLRVIYLSFLTFLLELTNPFDRKLLRKLVQKKLAFSKKISKKIQKVNGKYWDLNSIELEQNIYLRRSLMQDRIIAKIIAASSHAKKDKTILEAQKALKKGLFPILIIQGCSGAYWMRNEKREIIGLFKPFDEEIHGPNNPLGPKYQGALGERKVRWGVRIGEASHREVAAFIVDQFFEFGIVPRTHYASFAHHTFFDSRESRYGIRRNKLKFGSFQEYVHGFSSIHKLSVEETSLIPLDEYQLLVILDVIIGNSDRNAGNLLVSGEKIAAVDHGLSFPDVHESYTRWYWVQLPQGEKPFIPSIIKLLEEFPLQELGWKLKKRCFISESAIARMKERLALFLAGIKEGINTPKELAYLMEIDNLNLLWNLSETLPSKAHEVVENYLKNPPKNLKKISF